MRDCGEVPSAQCPGNPLPPLRNDPGRVQSCAGAPAPGGIARAPPEQINPLPPLSEPAVAASNDEDTTCKSYQFFHARIRCAARLLGELQERISSVRATRRWSLNAWKKQVKSIAAERSWGVCKHGGSRKARPKVQQVVSSNLPATGGNIQKHSKAAHDGGDINKNSACQQTMAASYTVSVHWPTGVV